MPFQLLSLARRLRVAALIFAGMLLCACALATDANVVAGGDAQTVAVTEATAGARADAPPPANAVAPVVAPELVDDEGYRLGAGDRINISVLGEADLSMDLVVDDQGDLNYPFLGELRVVGLTVNDVRDRITEGLQPDYLLDPRVTVQVLEYRKFFVNGEVQKPGGFHWQSGMTVRKAVALAGGFTSRAARSRLVIIREADVAKRPVQVEIDAPVAPGDIITIDQSFF